MIDEKPKCAVRIESESIMCQGTKIYINGEQVPNVTFISLAIGVDNVQRVVIGLVPDALYVSGVFDVTTLDSTAIEYRKGPEPIRA